MKLTAKAISAVRFPGCSSKHLQIKEKVNTVLNQSGRCQDTGSNTIETEHTMLAIWSLWHYALDKEPCSEALLQHSLSEGTDCQELLFILCLGGSQILPGLEKIRCTKSDFFTSREKDQLISHSNYIHCIIPHIFRVRPNICKYTH